MNGLTCGPPTAAGGRREVKELRRAGDTAEVAEPLTLERSEPLRVIVAAVLIASREVVASCPACTWPGRAGHHLRHCCCPWQREHRRKGRLMREQLKYRCCWCCMPVVLAALGSSSRLAVDGYVWATRAEAWRPSGGCRAEAE
jgi:hypothetical protein